MIAQLAPAATLEPQVLVWAKSPLLVPVIEMLEMVSAAPPELESVMVLAALLVPTVWFEKVRLVGDRLTDAVAPVPVRPAV